MRVEPEGSPDSSVSIMTQLAIQVGTDRVTFAPLGGTRDHVVMVNGSPVTIDPTQPVFTLAGGTVTEVSDDDFRVVLNTGEVVTIAPYGDGMGFSISLPSSEGAGSIQGFLGSDEGMDKEFQLPDGTVLAQPLSQDDFYHTFADAWRVTDSTSLLDYDPGQTTATFTNPQYPREVLTLADLPADLVAAAMALVAEAGITDPVLAADAALDYIDMGNPGSITEDAAIAGRILMNSTVVTLTNPLPPPLNVTVLAVQRAVTESTTGDTPVSFTIHLTRTATEAITVQYAVVSNGQNAQAGQTFFTAADFGGTAPSGSVTIAAGATQATVTVEVPRAALGTTPDKFLQVQVTPPDGVQLLSPVAQTEIVNSQPVPGTPAQPVVKFLAAADTTATTEFQAVLTQSGNTYTLNLGNVLEKTVIAPLQFAITNTAAAGSDLLTSAVLATSASSFSVYGTQPGRLGGGASWSQIFVQPSTTTLGAATEVLTFRSKDVNDSGYTADLSDITLTVSEKVIAPAQATIGATAFTFGPVRVGTSESRTFSVTNTAASGAANLDVQLAALSGAVASGAVSGLAPGATSSGKLSAGLDTSKAGAIQGQVTVDLFSDLGNTVEVAALPSPVVKVSGTVFREASGLGTLPVPSIIHVGDAGFLLGVSNTAADDGFSENLGASVTASSGVTIGAVPSSKIGAGKSVAVPVGLDTSTAGTRSGSVSLAFSSDGTGLDGAGPTSTGTQTVTFKTTIDNYASLGIAASGGQLTFDGTEYVLDLGTVQQGGQALSTTVSVSNNASGPADLLSGAITLSGVDGWSDQGSGTYANLAAGAVAAVETVTLATDKAGTFSQTLVLHSTGSNASGYSGALADQRVRITGTVASAASTVGSGPDDLVLNVSEDAYLGDALYTVSVDGQQIGGVQTATAAHRTGQSQVLDVKGTFGTTPHVVTVSFLNDAAATPYSATADRNLYVTGASYNGAALPNPDFAFFDNGSAAFTFGGVIRTATIGTGADTLALSLSEDAYRGDAEFTVSVDGQQIGGVQLTNASHAAGQSGTLNVLGDFGPGQHIVVVNFLNDAASTPFDPAMDRNLYLDTATINGTTIGNAQLVLDSNGPQTFSFGQPPATIAVGAGADTLALALSEDAYLGDAQFTISVDGNQVGGVLSTTALHAMGQSQTFDVQGGFGTGPHTVAVDFINDTYSPTGDRNLFVDNATINGTTIGGSTLAFYTGGSQSFSFGGPAAPVTIGAGSDTLDLSVSEDADLGNAQFTVSVDGSQIGGVLSASASHAAGQDQILHLLGSFGAGSHTVSVNFLNDAYSATADRNLYVDGATLNGSAVANSTLALYTGGPQSFTFTQQHSGPP